MQRVWQAILNLIVLTIFIVTWLFQRKIYVKQNLRYSCQQNKSKHAILQ